MIHYPVVLDLEKAKSDQAIKIASLKKRADKLKKRRMFRTTGFKRLKQLDAEKSSTKTGEAVTTAGVEDSAAPTIPTTVEAVTTASVEDSAAPTIPTTVEETLAQTLMEIKAAKPKAKGIVFHDVEEHVSKPTVSTTQPSVKYKGKGIMQEPERPLTKKDQVALDEDFASNIQAQLNAKIIEEERLERQKQEEANIALIES
ncbi:hypothetical protein Tco_0689364 [Tanacetum coccineum]